jgi:hypothetical protein
MRTTIQEPKSVKLTHSLAKRFAEMEAAPHDRPLRESRTAGLRRIVEAGEFRTCEWTSALCKETGKEYRINGKHTSSLFAEMNGDLPSINVLVSKYECETLQDIAALYCSFDTRQQARSVNDINRIYQATSEVLIGLPTRLVSMAVSGIAYEKWEDQSSHHPPDERALLMLDNEEFITFLCQMAVDGAQCNLRRSPVVAAIYRTYQKSKSDANDFWSLVRDATGPKHDSPDRLLSRWLDKTSVASGRTGSGKTRCSSREMYVRCIHAWNAWRRDEKTEMKYYAASKTPAAV